MIQICSNYCNQLHQEKYNDFTESLNFTSLTCSTCGVRGGCRRHAYYSRKIQTMHGKEDIRILRVECSYCLATHALLPKWIVPHSHHLVVDQVEIIRAFESGITLHQITPSNTAINIWNVIYIIKQYQYHWKQRLLAIKVSVFDEIEQLIPSCFASYNRQFMQIKRTRNLLFLQTT